MDTSIPASADTAQLRHSIISCKQSSTSELHSSATMEEEEEEVALVPAVARRRSAADDATTKIIPLLPLPTAVVAFPGPISRLTLSHGDTW